MLLLIHSWVSPRNRRCSGFQDWPICHWSWGIVWTSVQQHSRFLSTRLSLKLCLWYRSRLCPNRPSQALMSYFSGTHRSSYQQILPRRHNQTESTRKQYTNQQIIALPKKERRSRRVSYLNITHINAVFPEKWNEILEIFWRGSIMSTVWPDSLSKISPKNIILMTISQLAYWKYNTGLKQTYPDSNYLQNSILDNYPPSSQRGSSCQETRVLKLAFHFLSHI